MQHGKKGRGVAKVVHGVTVLIDDENKEIAKLEDDLGIAAQEDTLDASFILEGVKQTDFAAIKSLDTTSLEPEDLEKRKVFQTCNVICIMTPP